jgi:hypothetical protein
VRVPSEIHDRIRGILVTELDRRVFEAARRLPIYCVHNRRQPLDTRKTIDGVPNPHYNSTDTSRTIGFCMIDASCPEEWRGTICEDGVDAQRCPTFTPRVSREQLWDEFTTQLQNPTWLEENMPAVTALLWALEESSPPKLPWWKRLWFKFLRIQVEPLTPVVDPLKFLPGTPPEGSDGT